MPSAGRPDAPVPQLLIQDGAHNQGNPHVFFLPPMVSNPTTNGIFDQTLSPRIEICPSDLSGCTGPVLLTMVSGDGGEVRLDAANQLYIANWQTDQAGVVAGNYYRIRVLQGSSILALADVMITEGGKGLNAETGEWFELKDGRTLPIKVRIEEGAAASAPAQAGSEDGQAAVEVPAGALEEYVEISVAPAEPDEPLPPATSGTALPGTVYTFEPSGQQFSEPVEITLPLPPSLPDGVDPQGLRVYYAGPNGWEERPGTVDLANGVVTGLTTHFSSFAILPSRVTRCSGGQGQQGFETMEDALAAVGPGGTVTVCDGTYAVDSVSIGKPVTIEGEAGGARPVIQTTTARVSFFVEAVDSGTVRFRHLAFENVTSNPPNNYSVYARTTYDQVVVEDATFLVQAGNTGGLIGIGSTVAGARITVQGSSFSGGVIAMNVIDTRMDVFNSALQNHATHGIWYQNSTGAFQGNTAGPNCGTLNCVRVQQAGSNVTVLGNDFSDAQTGLSFHRIIFVRNDATARIEDNDFVGCGSATASSGNGQCVFGFAGAALEVVNNRFTLDGAHETGFVIYGQSAGTTVLATDNVITGVGAGSSGYGIAHCAMESEAGAILTLYRNTLSNVALGICGFNGGIVGDARDNVVSTVHFGIGVFGGSQVTARFNDITNVMGKPIDIPDSDPALSDLTCNWWGSAAGPANPDGLPAALFTPWATAPIAGTGATGCS